MKNYIKVIKAIINALMTLILIIGIVFILLFIIGIEPSVVESGSMEPSVHVGSLCFVNKHYSYDKIKEGDIIAFELPGGTKATHRVVSKTEEGLVTKGDANKDTDGIVTTKDNYYGKNIFSIPKVGYAIKATQTTRGRIVLITVIIVLLVAAFSLGESKGKRFKEENSEEE
jgi:signal peptidase